ncbi:Acg family FMN-binding oxidoreductase [Nocardioides aurantiacus]|uniref:Uncharacterized protein n=1 Tax=Nocardioides aurantiacus TaxID=86796 RepID=A0A3N2CTI9_9ACTN|nr:NAD(P)H nitroreductase [Nocardioides aurantiacus]ROR90852.1 hypothetical protein EDD33_1701 [Nocardioides aurantiacus]
MTAPAVEQLRRVVELACRAPSVHNSQPWRWRAHDGGSLELWADRSRQLTIADPQGRDLALSCGAAIHHAVTCGPALGLWGRVELAPDPSRTDLLARLGFEVGVVAADAADRLLTLERRSTDRRRFTRWPVPRPRLLELAAAAVPWGASAVPVTASGERARAEVLVLRAQEEQARDPALVEEQRGWLDHGRADGIVGRVAAPTRSPRPELPHRSRSDTTDLVPRLLDGTDGLLVLCTASDDQLHWLRAGAALSAVWFGATRSGLSLVPLSQVVEVATTRRDLRREVLSGAAHPQLLLRVGWQEIGRATMPRTPRRPLHEVLDWL